MSGRSELQVVVFLGALAVVCYSCRERLRAMNFPPIGVVWSYLHIGAMSAADALQNYDRAIKMANNAFLDDTSRNRYADIARTSLDRYFFVTDFDPKLRAMAADTTGAEYDRRKVAR